MPLHTLLLEQGVCGALFLLGCFGRWAPADWCCVLADTSTACDCSHMWLTAPTAIYIRRLFAPATT